MALHPEATLDLTGDPPPARLELPFGASLETRQPYDPSRDREKVRGVIALLLIILLFAIVLGLLAGIGFGALPIETVEKLAAVVLSPIVGLIGAVLGFSFGEQSRRAGS